MPKSVEVGLVPTCEYGTFLAGQQPAFKVDIYNGYSKKQAVKLNYQIKDYTDNLISEKSIKLKLEPGKSDSFKVKLDSFKTYSIA